MSEYELKSVKLPRLTGTGLRLFAALLRTRMGRGLLWPKLAADAGIPKLAARDPEEAPAFTPTYGDTPSKLEDRAAALAALDTIDGSVKTPHVTCRDYARAYRDGKATPLEVAERVLQAIDASGAGDTPLNLFIAVDRDDVRRQAEISAERIAAGKPRSLLDGVPVAVKDEVDMQPYPTTVGTAFLGDAPAKTDSTVVARLRDAGALLIGKANMHEIGINPTGANTHYGHCRNPWNLQRDTGGSSSGSAAAVAAGICPIAVGADGGGSIRVPAALCGAVGLKPTWGRISEHGAAPLCWSVAHLGPIAATVEDAAILYRVIAGPDPSDPNTLTQPAVHLDEGSRDDLTGLRVGVYSAWFDHCHPAIRQSARAAVDRLVARGARPVEIVIPQLDEIRIAHAITILSEMATAMDRHRNQFDRLAPATRINLTLGASFASVDYVRAQRMRRRAMGHFAHIFEQVDVIATPSTALPAPLPPDGGEPWGWSDLSTVTELMRYAAPANLTGLPGITVPVGYTDDGLPIGLQLMAGPWQEALLLRMAHAVEQEVERQQPTVLFRPLDEIPSQ